MTVPENIIVIGITGVGKSTWLNDTFGTKNKTARAAMAQTKITTSTRCTVGGKQVNVWDCPGIFDDEVTLEDWAEQVMKATEGKKFKQIYLVHNATTRAGTLDIFVLTCLKEVMTQTGLEEGVTTVFTHCDVAKKYLDETERNIFVDVLNKKATKGNLTAFKLNPKKTIAFISKEGLAQQIDEEKKKVARKYLKDSEFQDVTSRMRQIRDRSRSPTRVASMGNDIDKTIMGAMQSETLDVVHKATQQTTQFGFKRLDEDAGQKLGTKLLAVTGPVAMAKYGNRVSTKTSCCSKRNKQ